MKVKIVNRKRFVRSIGVLLFILIFSVLIGICNKTFSHKETKFKTKYVSSGDTLWSIAKQEQTNNEYYQNKDIRYIINNIKNTNKLSSDKLYINQEIIIPTI